MKSSKPIALDITQDVALRRPDDLLTERRAQAEELPMRLDWWHKKRLLGGGPPFIRISNRIFYRRSELRKWIAEREVR